MTTLSVINVFPTSKEEIQEFFKDAKDRILSGYDNPLKIASQLASFEKVIELLSSDKEIKEATLKEAEKQNGKTFKLFGAEFQIKEAGVKYDYSVCDDQIWNDLNIKLANISELKKERESFLKTIKSKIFDENGVEINTPVKTSQTVVTIKIL